MEFICEDYLAEQNDDDVFPTELIFCVNPQCYTAHLGELAPHVIRVVSLHHGANMTCLSTSLFSTCLPISPHLVFILLPPLRSKWRTLPQMPPAAPLPPPPLRPPLTSRSPLRCCAPPLPQLHPASSANLHRCRRARFRTERPTTTLRLRSSDPL